MADENSNTDETNDELENDNANSEEGKSVDERIQAGIDAALKPIKAKLDTAFTVRDDALAEVKDFKEKERKADLKRLEDEGKHKEAFDLQLTEINATNAALQKQNTELTRDISVRDALRDHDFRNKNASEMAFREIVGDLVQDEHGKWVHKTGKTIGEFAEEFLERSDNSFLLKPKTSSGSGSSSSQSTDTSGNETSIFKKSQDDVLKLAAEGKLRKRR